MVDSQSFAMKGPLKVVSKPWGFEEWWVNENEYCFKILVLKQGFHSSKHWHLKKKETFIVKNNYCVLKLWDKMGNMRFVTLHAEEHIVIEPNTPHEFYLDANAEMPCVIYEVSTHHDDHDVVREYESGTVTVS